MFAIIPREQLFGTQILDIDVVAIRQAVVSARYELKVLCEKRPCVEPIPLLVELGCNAKLGFALLQHLGNLVAGAAEKLEFQPIELAFDLVQEGDQE